MIYRRQTDEHLIEAKSREQFKLALLEFEWISQEISPDYGEDLQVRIFENGNPTGNDFLVQLKGTDDCEKYRLKSTKDFSYPIDLANLIQWRGYNVPVILVLWDIKTKIGYWACTKTYINGELDKNPDWLENLSNAKEPTRKVHIPGGQIISCDEIDSLKLTINRFWQRYKQATKHFDILFKANSGEQEKFNIGLPNYLSNQLRINELNVLSIDQPNQLENWIELSSLLYNLCDYKKGLKAINSAWKIDKEDNRIKWIKACIQAEYVINNLELGKGLIEESINLFQSINDVSQSVKYYNIGNCYAAINEHHTAVKYYNQALNSKDFDLDNELKSSILANLGSSFNEIGNIKKAVKSCKKAIEYNSLNWNAYSLLAHIEAKLNNHSSACKYFEKLFELNLDLENDGNSHLYCYALSLYEIKRYSDALEAIETLLISDPINENALNLKVHVVGQLLRLDKYDVNEASVFLKRRLLDNPEDMMARSDLIQIYHILNQRQEFVAFLKESSSLKNAPLSMLFNYAIILKNEGQIDESISIFERIFEVDKSHSISHNLAILYHYKKRYPEAIEKYRIAIGDEYSSLSLLSAISDCLDLMGDYTSNIVLLTKILLMGANGSRFKRKLFFSLEKIKLEYEDYQIFFEEIESKKNYLDENFIKNEFIEFVNNIDVYKKNYLELVEINEFEDYSTLDAVQDALIWEKLRDKNLKEIGYNSSFDEDVLVENHPGFDATDEEWADWLIRTTDFEKLEAELQAGLNASIELNSEKEAQKDTPFHPMTQDERLGIVKIQLNRVREGWEDLLVLRDRKHNLNFVQVTEYACEVSAFRMKSNKRIPLSKKQSSLLKSIGFQEPNLYKDGYNFRLDWYDMSIENISAIVINSFIILDSGKDCELIVEK